MKFINRIIIIIIFFLLFVTGSTFADEKTAFINIDYIVKNSNIGKKVLDKIEVQNKKNITLLEKKNKFLKNLEIEIKNKKNVISEKDFNDEVLSFQKKVQAFNKEKDTIVKEFNNLRSKEINNIFELINPIVNNYMKENSISVLLDSKNIFMGNQSANLTNIILTKINNELK